MKITLHTIKVRDLVEGFEDNDENGVTVYGGKTTMENLQMLCRYCNNTKSDK